MIAMLQDVTLNVSEALGRLQLSGVVMFLNVCVCVCGVCVCNERLSSAVSPAAAD